MLYVQPFRLNKVKVIVPYCHIKGLFGYRLLLKTENTVVK